MADQKPRRARLVFLLWLLVAIFYTYLASDYVQVVMRDDEFAQYLQVSVQLVGAQDRTSRELRQLVMAKARELEIPIDPERVQISGERQTLRLNVGYEVDIAIPLISEAGYQKDFEHEVSFGGSQ
jgi:SOS response regulatory protein OraA/RecX